MSAISLIQRPPTREDIQRVSDRTYGLRNVPKVVEADGTWSYDCYVLEDLQVGLQEHVIHDPAWATLRWEATGYEQTAKCEYSFNAQREGGAFELYRFKFQEEIRFVFLIREPYGALNL